MVAFEAAGMDEKVWLADPATSELWLYKPVTRHQNWAERNLDPVQGENWAEKITSELARRLGVPAAAIEMAQRLGTPGCISLNLVPPGWEMQPGTVLLSEIVPGYDPTPRGGHHGHTLDNIQRVLDGYCAPLGWTRLPAGFNAFDVFAGYVVFDAWIANRDRHSENWAVLRGPLGGGPPSLSPSYDHASCLGYHLTQRRLEEIINGRGVGWFATRRDSAYRYEDGMSQTLVEFAHSALRAASASARDHWLDRLAAVDSHEWASIVHATPEMSEVARSFVVELLETNRRRLLDA
ncbi:hypothetical protein [Acrocarpospora sp. B8E8]|uniref:hypothetical protein n=1 Tax=Acrocarpospora sp. B8E8 TaxID=3153572 RepID=UPI00325F22FC